MEIKNKIVNNNVGMKFLAFTGTPDTTAGTEEIAFLPASALSVIVNGATNKLELHFKDTSPQMSRAVAEARAVARAAYGSRGADDDQGTLAQSDLTFDSGNVDRTASADVLSQSDDLVVELTVAQAKMIEVANILCCAIHDFMKEDSDAVLEIIHGTTSVISSDITGFVISMEDRT